MRHSQGIALCELPILLRTTSNGFTACKPLTHSATALQAVCSIFAERHAMLHLMLSCASLGKPYWAAGVRWPHPC